MTMSAIEHDPVEILAAVVRLLDLAAERVWAQAEQEGPRSSHHLLGVGICATANAMLDLLAADASVDVDAHTLDAEDPIALLRAAEQLTRTISLPEQPHGLSGVAVGICDLAREAKSYGE